MAIQKRRSDRLMLTVPLRIEGTDVKGTAFKDEARTIVLNRHGARIYASRSLIGGQVIRVMNLISQRQAEFRVVGLLAPITEKGGEWGVECVDINDNIWGIQFPPPVSGSTEPPKALLECRKCHTLALTPVSLVEVEVLETSGILTKPCQTCEVSTPWGYAEKQMSVGAPPLDTAMKSAEGAATRTGSGIDQRRHRRVALQLPVLVRDYYGGVEITKSENISKSGFCYVSEKDHLIGAGLLVVCPYSTEGQNIEVPAHIVRRQEVEGTHRRIYGVRFDTPKN